MSDASLRDIFARALTEYSDQSGVSDDNDEVTLDELGLGLLPDLVRHAAGVVLAGFPTLAIPGRHQAAAASRWVGTAEPPGVLAAECGGGRVPPTSPSPGAASSR